MMNNNNKIILSNTDQLIVMKSNYNLNLLNKNKIIIYNLINKILASPLLLLMNANKNQNLSMILKLNKIKNQSNSMNYNTKIMFKLMKTL